MTDNVLQFPKSVQKVANKVKAGEKPTRQQAMNALGDTGEMMNNMFQRIAQSQLALEEAVGRLDTNTHVMFKLMFDKGLITGEDWDTAWKKYVTDPAETALTQHIEVLKTKSGEDAYFASVIEKVRVFEFPSQILEDRQIDGETVKGYYMQMLLQEQTRKMILGELITKIPGLPTYNPEPSAPVVEEAIHPECHYCGAPSCEFCNPSNIVLSE